MDLHGFLKLALTGLVAFPGGAFVDPPLPVRSPNASGIPADPAVTLVNDVHSQLNATHVNAILRPASVPDVQAAIRAARTAGRSVCVAGGRHAMGGQQFADAGVLLDMRPLSRVLAFDEDR